MKRKRLRVDAFLDEVVQRLRRLLRFILVDGPLRLRQIIDVARFVDELPPRRGKDVVDEETIEGPVLDAKSTHPRAFDTDLTKLVKIE